LKDESKTKEQLIDELVELRRQIAELKASEPASDATKAARKPPEKRRPVRVGEVLMQMGYLTRLQLERALRKQKEADMRGDSHIPVGKILVESGIVTAEQLQIALAEQRKRLEH
jgi:hypothetical protein